MAKRIYLAGTCDTKFPELDYVRARIREAGAEVALVDLSTTGTPHDGADIQARDIAAYHPDGAVAVFTGDRGSAVAAMAVAFQRFAAARDDLAGMIGLGGSGGTALITPAMRALDVGVPKLMVSTVASGNVEPYVGPSDVTMMYSVTDVAGLNRISRRVLANAAGAIGAETLEDCVGAINDIADAARSVCDDVIVICYGKPFPMRPSFSTTDRAATASTAPAAWEGCRPRTR